MISLHLFDGFKMSFLVSLLRVKAKVEKAGSVVEKADSLLLLPLFRHLISKVGQLARKGLH